MLSIKFKSKSTEAFIQVGMTADDAPKLTQKYKEVFDEIVNIPGLMKQSIIGNYIIGGKHIHDLQRNYMFRC